MYAADADAADVYAADAYAVDAQTVDMYAVEISVLDVIEISVIDVHVIKITARSFTMTWVGKVGIREMASSYSEASLSIFYASSHLNLFRKVGDY